VKNKYLQLKKKGVKAEKSADLSSLKIPDNYDYLKQTIFKYDELKKALEGKKNEKNQLSNYSELEAILNGKNLKAYYKTGEEKARTAESKIDYSEGNHLWVNRCENLKKYFSNEENQKKELLEYVFSFISKQAEKLKAKDGTAKISAYEKNLEVFNEVLSDIARAHYRNY